MAKSGDTPTNGTKLWIAAVVAFISGGVGGGSGTYYVLAGGLGPTQLQEIARPDPYTGTQGQALDRRIGELERRITDVEDRIRDDYLKDLADRLERLEGR